MEEGPVANFFQDLEYYNSSKQLPDHLARDLKLPEQVKVKWFDLMSNELRTQQINEKVTAKELSEFVVRLLHQTNVVDVEVFLKYYSLPVPDSNPLEIRYERPLTGTPSFHFSSLPVNMTDIGDGDSFTCYAKLKEFATVPVSVIRVMEQHQKAVSKKKTRREKDEEGKLDDRLYSFRIFKGKRVVCRKYNIRLRGIDAPKLDQSYGVLARESLKKLIHKKELHVIVNHIDPLMRCVADVYFDEMDDGILVQDVLLKNGDVWQHIHFDDSSRFRKLQEEAKNKRVGLWQSNEKPIPPWEWKKGKRR